jgi:hypothetical protein
LPYDYFPGGEYPLPINISSSSYSGVLGKYSITVNANQPSFDFVPVPSALDLGSGSTALGLTDYLAGYIGAYPPAAPKASPFSAFVTAFGLGANNNEQHIQITQHNGNWVYDQLVGTPITDNCGFVCSNRVTISGPTKLCTGSQVYTLSGLTTPNDAVVTWSASPSGVVSITPNSNGSQATITRVGNGTVTITAHISSAFCDGAAITETLSIQVGAPTVNVIGTPGSCSNGYQTWTLAATPSSLGTNWHWTVGYLGTNSSITINSPTSAQTNISVKGGGIVNLTYTDNCGNAESSSLTVYSQCSGNGVMAVSPNPTTGMVVISTTPTPPTAVTTDAVGDGTKEVTSAEAPSAVSNTTTLKKIYQVRVLAPTGTLLRQYTFPSGNTQVNLDLSSLKNGLYIVQVFDSNSWTSQQVIVLK